MEMFGKHCDSGLYTLKYKLLDHMVQDLQISQLLLVLQSLLHERFFSYINQANRTNSQHRRTRMMENGNVIEIC